MKEKKSYKFSIFAISFALFWILLTIIACLLLWKYLTVYEQSTPIHAGKQILELYRQGKFEEAMDVCEVIEDGMFDVETYQKYIESSLGSDYDNVKIYEGIKDAEGNRILEMLGKSNNPLKFYLHEEANALDYGLSSYSLTQCEIETLTYSFTFPEEYSITVNGKQINTDGFTRDVVESFDVFETKNDVPYTKTGSLTGFIEEPTVEIPALESDRYTVDLENGLYTVTVKPDAEKQKAVEESAVEISKAFAKYLFNDGSYTALGKLAMKESSSYQRLKDYERTWIIKHSSYKISNIVPTNFIQYSSNSYSVDVTLDYDVVSGAKSRTYPCNYRVFLMEIDGELKMAAIEMN